MMGRGWNWGVRRTSSLLDYINLMPILDQRGVHRAP